MLGKGMQRLGLGEVVHVFLVVFAMASFVDGRQSLVVLYRGHGETWRTQFAEVTLTPDLG
jgi:hypothetical protein